MVAYLTKSDASKGFNQIIDFLNGSYIKYALTVNPNIYVSCIKQIWNNVAIKQVNDVTRLQGLVDKKKVVVTEAVIRESWLEWDTRSHPPSSHFIKPSSQATESSLFTPSSRARVLNELDGMNLAHQWRLLSFCLSTDIEGERDAYEHVEEVTAGDDAHGDDSAAHGEVSTVTQEPSIPSPTPPTPPPQPPQDVPSTSQVHHPNHLSSSSGNKKVKKKGEENREEEQGRMIAEMDKDDDVVLMDEKEEDKKVKEAKVVESAQVQGRQAESQAEIYKIDMNHANKVLSMQKDETEPTEVQEVVDVVTTAKLITKKLHAELNKDINWDVAIDHVKLKAKEDPALKRYQAMKRKPQTEAQARKNMMMYLKNVAGFKLDYFKGMSYDHIRPIFEAKFNSNVDFLLKTKEQTEEEENRALQTINKTPIEKAAKRRKLNEEVEDLKTHLQIVPNEDDDIYTEATPLVRKVLVMYYEIIELNNKHHYKIIRADGTHQLYVSFLSLLRNFDREDLKALWSLVNERFSTAKPKNFSDDFLLTTLGAMFEKPAAHA
nr:hypothetical protein [Tanacetum cinerariifolium]